MEPAQPIGAESVDEPVRYVIDPEWYEQHDRDFVAFAAFRFCPNCQQLVGSEREERVPRTDPKTGKVVFESRAIPYGSDPIAVIRACCSKSKGYLTPGLPVMETIFRVFLANGNRPMTADELKSELENWTGPADRVRFFTSEALDRVLANDEHYGFQPVLAASDHPGPTAG